MSQNNSAVFATSLPRIAPHPTMLTSSYPPLPLGSATQTCPAPKLVNQTGAVKHKTLQNIGIPSVYAVYPQKPITSVPENDFHGMNNRVNPLRPPGCRRTAMLETVDRNHHNEQRSDLMKRMTRLRYHTAYEKYPYGSPAEKEIYNRLFREGLKQQMLERDRRMKEQFMSKVTESQEAFMRDQNDLKSMAEKHQTHHEFMTTYRDANKQIMEQKWANTKSVRESNKEHELEILRYNPINWSSTLK